MNVRSLALAFVFSAALLVPAAGCGSSPTEKEPTTNAPLDPNLKQASRSAGGAGGPGSVKPTEPLKKD